MATFRKGQRVWLIGIDDAALWTVYPATVVNPVVDEGKTVFVRKVFERDGKAESVVVDRDTKDLFATERAALVEAAERCQAAAERHTVRGNQLLKLALTKR